MSLLTALHCSGHVHLVTPPTPIAASRATSSLAAGAQVILVGKTGQEPLHYTLQTLVDSGKIQWIQEDFRDELITTLGREEVDHIVDAVFVTSKTLDTSTLVPKAHRLRIPLNIIDNPVSSTITLLSVHTSGPLQIGVTTNGSGCKLASRIRRDIAAALPANLGDAITRIGAIRRRLIQEEPDVNGDVADGEESTGVGCKFNALVKEGSDEAGRGRRLRWLSQVVEYWPLSRLATATEAEIQTVLNASDQPQPTATSPSPESTSASPPPVPSLLAPTKTPKIILAGSGPGHPSLLTRATLHAIQSTDIILADKLVPAGVLALIPRRTPVTIARKFPGNADAAQQELHDMAITAYQAGKVVLRLKQGDPYIYGRGGEEVLFFEEKGVARDAVIVIPGITSALSAATFAGIPATQRDVADQVLICTGTGKKGAAPTPPDFVKTRTTVFLMALHRISGLVSELTTHLPSEIESGDLRRKLFPKDTPCAVIERATCPDQRVMRTTLEWVERAIEAEGSRPPGLLVVGRACDALQDARDPVKEGQMWTVEDGFSGLDIDTGRLDGLE